MPKQLNINLGFTADTTQARRQVQELQNMLKNLVNNASSRGSQLELTKEIQTATEAAARLQVQLKEAINVNTGQLDLSKFSEALNKSNMNLKQYQEQLANLGSAGDAAFSALAKSISNAEIPLTRTNSLLSNTWTTLQNTARWQFSSGLLHSFIGTLQSAYGYAQDLNKSLTDIQIVTGHSSEKMAEFAERANKAAQALSASTTQYTDAALIFYQQGEFNAHLTFKSLVILY